MSRTKIAVSSVVVAAAAVFTTVAVANPAAPAVVKPKPVVVTVAGSEYAFKVSKRKLPRNKPIVFKFKNVGDEVHDFAFQRPKKKTAFITSGKSATLKVTFKKKGTYLAICTVGEHFLRGMKISFVVK